MIQQLLADQSMKKYKVVVIKSGDGDLFSSTEGLLLNNLAG